MSDDNSVSRQSVGVNISGGSVTVGGDIVGRDKNVRMEISRVQLDQTLRGVEEALRAASPETQAEALQKLEELKTEASKGHNARDTVVAKLVDGLVQLIPGAVSAVVSAFGAPILAGVAGPATKYVLDKIQDK
jgi:hypothetical protein